MNLNGFIWFESIVEKLWREYRVEQREVAEVFGTALQFSFERGHRTGEDVCAALGQVVVDAKVSPSPVPALESGRRCRW